VTISASLPLFCSMWDFSFPSWLCVLKHSSHDQSNWSSPFLNLQSISNLFSEVHELHVMYCMNWYIYIWHFLIICKYSPNFFRFCMTYFNDLCPLLVNLAFVIAVDEYIKRQLWTLPSRVYRESTIKLVYYWYLSRRSYWHSKMNFLALIMYAKRHVN
jgi:hypothetical protein